MDLKQSCNKNSHTSAACFVLGDPGYPAPSAGVLDVPSPALAPDPVTAPGKPFFLGTPPVWPGPAPGDQQRLLSGQKMSSKERVPRAAFPITQLLEAHRGGAWQPLQKVLPGANSAPT